MSSLLSQLLSNDNNHLLQSEHSCQITEEREIVTYPPDHPHIQDGHVQQAEVLLVQQLVQHHHQHSLQHREHHIRSLARQSCHQRVWGGYESLKQRNEIDFIQICDSNLHQILVSGDSSCSQCRSRSAVEGVQWIQEDHQTVSQCVRAGESCSGQFW